MQQTLATEWSPQAYVTSTKGNWKRWLQTRPYRILLRRFGSANTASVTCADIGAADGANGAMLLRAGLIGAYHALELDEDLRKVAATRGLTASSFDAEHDEIPGQFDVVLCLHVCEHVRSPDFFDRLARGVKPGGVLIAATPNLSGLCKSLMQKAWIGFGDPTHINLKTHDDWLAQIRSTGLEIKFHGSSYVNDAPIWLFPMKIISQALYFVFGYAPWRRGNSSVFVARKPPA